MHFYTSVNNNYLPKARILAKSVKQHCKNSTFSLVLSDALPAEVDPTKEPFDEILTVEQLGIPVENLQYWIFIHSVVELCTAVKGQALVKFLESGSEKVVYLDPDIAVFDDLSELETLLDTHDVVLTPHQSAPENTTRGIEDNEICSLAHGVFNYGFYAVHNTENGMAYAKWWRDRLLEYCYDDIPRGLFTDQRWGDLAPCLFDNVYIWRNPACNVSTWNLTHRNVTKDEKTGRYLVNNLPLQFYHFSGFDSGAQEIMLRVAGNDNKNLFALREWYIKRMAEEEQEKYGTLPSIYNFFDNGEKIEHHVRALLRNRLDVTAYFKDTDPFKVEQVRSYYKWYLNEFGSLQNSKEESMAEVELRNIKNSKAWRFSSKVCSILDKLKG
ncbi:MAG: hypothetical protein RSD23_02690 [Ruthenibacterium sp.]